MNHANKDVKEDVGEKISEWTWPLHINVAARSIQRTENSGKHAAHPSTGG